MSADVSKLLLAATFAAEKHRDQRRKNVEASPYINHPLAVANLLVSDGGVTDLDLIVAAILHDTVEDTRTSIDEIADLFGTKTSQIVAEVTDDKSLPKAERKQLQIEKSPGKSDGAKQLKIADKICNIRDLNEDSPTGWETSRKIEYLDWAERVVAGCRRVNPKLDDLFEQELALACTRVKDQHRPG